MSDERKPPMPEQPTTTSLPQVPPWAIELTRTMKIGFAKVDVIANDLEEVRGRVVDLEAARKDHSIKAKSTSQNDMRQDSAIATIVTRVESIEANQKTAAEEHSKTKSLIESNTATTERIEKAVTTVFNSPLVKAITWALWVALAGWLASKGITVKQ